MWVNCFDGTLQSRPTVVYLVRSRITVRTSQHITRSASKQVGEENTWVFLVNELVCLRYGDVKEFPCRPKEGKPQDIFGHPRAVANEHGNGTETSPAKHVLVRQFGHFASCTCSPLFYQFTVTPDCLRPHSARSAASQA